MHNLLKFIKILSTAPQTNSDTVHTDQHKDSFNIEIVYMATIQDVI
jgi:hypothetical protein